MTRLATLTGVLALLAAAGCGTGPPPGAMDRLVVREHLGFALDAPEGWLVRDLAGDLVVEIAEPAGADSDAVVLHVAVLPREGLDLDTWAGRAVDDLGAYWTGVEVVNRQPAALADGREALDLVLVSTRGPAPLAQRMRLAVTDDSAYALLATGPKARLEAMAGRLEKTLETFAVW